MKFIFFLIFMLFQLNLFSQPQSTNDFDFLLSKIKSAYAGYDDKINNKTFRKILDEVKVSKLKDTFLLLSKITTYFNDYHLSLFKKNILEEIDSNILNKNLENIKKGIKIKNGSFWLNENNNIIVYFVKKEKDKFEGYVVESKKSKIKGLKLFTMLDKDEKKWKTDFINIDRNFRIFTKSFFKDKNTIIIGSYDKFKKIDNYYEGFLDTKLEISKKPEFVKLDGRNVLLRMPAFNEEFINIYDSLIKHNNAIISESENFIIDLRNNQGGYTNCFDSIIPFACKTDIVTSGGFTLCSKELIENAIVDRDEAIKFKDSSLVKYYNNYIKNLEKHKKSFYYTTGDTIKCNFKKNNLKQISIIINYGCRSAAELMLLYLKQSSKVKLFGENTAGAVDYLDILSYTLPSSHFKLWVGSVKRELNSAQPSYDITGIKPDVYIDESVTNWVNFVKDYYGKN